MPEEKKEKEEQKDREQKDKQKKQEQKPKQDKLQKEKLQKDELQKREHKLQQDKLQQEKLQKEKKIDKRIKYVIFIIIIIFASLIIAFAFKDNITDFIKEQAGTTFMYNNFKFEKVYFGKLLMYQTEIYLVKNNQAIRYDLLFRNDPRELAENIDVSFENSKIRGRSYFSIAPETDDCNDTILAAWKVSEFLGALGINNTGAATNSSAIANSSYIEEPDRIKTCEDAVNSTVIILQKSPTNESFISQEYEGKNYVDCFVLNYADCEVVQVAERFILFLIEEFNKRQ